MPGGSRGIIRGWACRRRDDRAWWRLKFNDDEFDPCHGENPAIEAISTKRLGLEDVEADIIGKSYE